MSSTVGQRPQIFVSVYLALGIPYYGANYIGTMAHLTFMLFVYDCSCPPSIRLHPTFHIDPMLDIDQAHTVYSTEPSCYATFFTFTALCPQQISGLPIL